jgi:hypothetical protein
MQPAHERGEAEDQEQVADDRSGQRRLDQIDQAFAQREDADDQLGRIAERGVQQAADAAAEPLRERFGGSADAGRERQQREQRRREHDDMPFGHHIVKGDRDRNEDEQIPHERGACKGGALSPYARAVVEDRYC